MNNTPLETARIIWDKQGTPVSQYFDDIYFSQENGLEETRYVFLEGNKLTERINKHKDPVFVIAETGFGTGLNFLSVWQLWHNIHRQANTSCSLHFISFEQYPLQITDLARSHAAWPELQLFSEQLLAQWPEALSGCHSLMFDNRQITLDLWLGDVNACLPQLNKTVDAWFLDGFAPAKNPSMWQETMFKNMAARSRPGTTFATFTAAGIVQRGLKNAGFTLTKQKGFGRKREMLTGIYSVTSIS